MATIGDVPSDHNAQRRRTPLGRNRSISWRGATYALAALACAVLAGRGLCQTPAAQVKSAPLSLTQDGETWVEATLRGLSLEEKVGQMLQVRSYADYANFEAADYQWLRERLQKEHVGSVVLAAHIRAQGLVRVDPAAAAKVLNQLQQDSKLPLLVAADLERGLASRVAHTCPFLAWVRSGKAVQGENGVIQFLPTFLLAPDIQQVVKPVVMTLTWRAGICPQSVVFAHIPTNPSGCVRHP